MARISKEQLIKLQAKYKTDEAIGKIFNITRQAVHQLRNKYCIPPLKNKHAERNQQIIEAYQAGMSGIKLAKRFKISISQNYRIIRSKCKNTHNSKKRNKR